MKYSSDQVAALDAIEDWINTKGAPAHVLTGSAGVGKTTVIAKIVEIFNKTHPNYNVFISATTNKASAVLHHMHGFFDATTVHKLFGIVPTISSYGKEMLSSNGSIKYTEDSLIIIDEASMISHELLKLISDSIKYTTAKILFVGDPYQLPPISDSCPVFDGSIPTSKLITVHRQKGDNPILDTAIEFRDFINGTSDVYPRFTESVINESGFGIHVLPKEEWIKKYIKEYYDYSAGDPVTSPMCTYTNKAAMYYNELIRKTKFMMQGSYEPFTNGELMISNASTKECKIFSKNAVNNNETLLINDITQHVHAGVNGYLLQCIRSSSGKSITNRIDLFVAMHEKEKRAAIKLYKQKAMDITIANKTKAGKGLKVSSAEYSAQKKAWREFYDFKNTFADLRPPFAGTIHKAQGSTYDSVFLDLEDINKCRDPLLRARLLYVGLTRARENVYIPQ